MSMYNASRTTFLLSTLPAHYQDEPDPILSDPTSISFFEPKFRSTSIRPSRSKFISHQLHTQISHSTASLLQSKLLAIYYPAWSQFNNGCDLHSQLDGLNSNINARDTMTADLRLIWFGYQSKVGEEDLESRNREYIIKDLGERYSCFVRESQKTFTFLSHRFELAYAKLFETFHNAKTIPDKDFILYQIEQVDIVVLTSIMKEDINELEFRVSLTSLLKFLNPHSKNLLEKGARISPLLECHTLADNAEREVFGGLVRLLQSTGKVFFPSFQLTSH